MKPQQRRHHRGRRNRPPPPLLLFLSCRRAWASRSAPWFSDGAVEVGGQLQVLLGVLCRREGRPNCELQLLAVQLASVAAAIQARSGAHSGSSLKCECKGGAGQLAKDVERQGMHHAGRGFELRSCADSKPQPPPRRSQWALCHRGSERPAKGVAQGGSHRATGLGEGGEAREPRMMRSQSLFRLTVLRRVETFDGRSSCVPPLHQRLAAVHGDVAEGRDRAVGTTIAAPLFPRRRRQSSALGTS